MKQLFKQPKVEVNKDDTSTTTTKNIHFDLEGFKKSFLTRFVRYMTISGLVVGFSIGGLIVVNDFFNKHYFEFRSPVILQAPVLLHDRTKEVNTPAPTSKIIDQVQAEVMQITPTPKKEVLLSKKARLCYEAQPIVGMKLEQAFGDQASAAIELLSRESCLDPTAINKSSGAAGLFQFYPASKLKCDLIDVDCQIDQGKKYIESRYKTAEAALLFHDRKGWY